MKKVIFIIAIILSFIVVILSCKKQHDDSKVNPINQVNQTNQNIEQRILTFKSEIENRLKSGSSYPIDTAVRYTEALINYTYGDVANNLQGLDIDSVFIDVDLTGGKVTPAEAASVYDEIIDSLTVQYQNLPSQNLHLIFADVFRRDSISGSVTFGVISAFGYVSPINYGRFGDEDWWMFGLGWCNSGGYCDGPYEGTHTNSDAAEQIEYRIRVNIGVPGLRHYSTDVVTLDIWPDGLVHYYGDPPNGIPPQNYYCDFLNYEDETTEDNYYDYLCFVNYYALPNFHDCLCPDEMNFYLHGEESVCTDLIFECDDLGDLIEDKVFMSINNEGSIYYGFPNYSYVHIMTNTYGLWVVDTNQPGTFN
ncbi:MAG: hypothetical protein M0Q51_00345 [Bacteroidales bacterium]|nr:hypothetical protein [Bacteroidales bacterium]